MGARGKPDPGAAAPKRLQSVVEYDGFAVNYESKASVVIGLYQPASSAFVID